MAENQGIPETRFTRIVLCLQRKILGPRHGFELALTPWENSRNDDVRLRWDSLPLNDLCSDADFGSNRLPCLVFWNYRAEQTSASSPARISNLCRLLGYEGYLCSFPHRPVTRRDIG